MQRSRPVFLELWRIRLPIPGIVSILHRISGLLMVLLTPVLALLFERALSGPEGFESTAALLASWPARLVMVLLAWSLLHHLLAGIRFLLLDMDIGLDRPVARRSAWSVLALALALLVVVVVTTGGLFA